MIYFAGDISLTDGYFDVGFGVGSSIEKGFDPFRDIRCKEDDLWIGNFEGVAADVTNKKGSASSQFRISPKYLKNIGNFNFYGFANNHAMQHGENAYDQTVDALEEYGAILFGMKEKKSVVFEYRGHTISLTGFSNRIDSFSEHPSYWHNPEYHEIKTEVEKLPQEAFKVLFIHWGNEFINYPSSQQKKFAHWLIDSGFDLIIGMHPHILQGYEVYKGKYIFYSIGNFVFDMAWEPTHYGAIVNVDFSGGKANIGAEYIRIGENFAPVVVSEKDVPKQYRFEALNELLSKEENSEEYHAAINCYYKQYRRANHKDIIKKMTRHPSVAVGIVKDYIKRRF